MKPKDYHGIIHQIDDGYAMLFLGAGSTRNCRRPDGKRGVTGEELAEEILAELNGGTKPNFNNPGLMQTAEFYTNVSPHAPRTLNTIKQNQLSTLPPSLDYN